MTTKKVIPILSLLLAVSSPVFATTDFIEGKAELQISQATDTLEISGDAARTLADHVGEQQSKPERVTVTCYRQPDGGAICDLVSDSGF